MKSRLFSIAAICLASELVVGTAVCAEEARFTGPAVAIGLGVARNQIDWSGASTTSSDKKTTAVGRLDCQTARNSYHRSASKNEQLIISY